MTRIASEPKLTLLQKLNVAMGRVDYIQKEKKQGMRYSIVSHDAVTAKVRPVLAELGVVYYPHDIQMRQVGNRTEMQMVVRFVNVDEKTDFIDVHTAGYGIDDQDKGPGKAISYSVKYALLKALGLESGDDPDEDQDTTHENPNDPHIVNLNDFMAEVIKTDTVKDLEALGASWKSKLDQAGMAFPAKVQSARSAYAQQLKKLKAGGTDG